ncbi:MAG: DEAD/DEAH box helicase [Deltaproteobacteria bacterium]|nr:DEAD/DEAH box helicase [Deltaproteobacteria bacterium]
MTQAHAAADYASWFGRFAAPSGAAALRPRQWQEALARDATPRSRVIRIPTGYGKTLGVLGAWLYHRVERDDDRWPRRLVWVLPMRVLVEQTAGEVQAFLARLGCLWEPGTDHRGKVGAHLLMGGTDPGGEWNLYPEERAVFLATQDMALSRALNRGYAAPRARWPMEFGLLSQDVLWVLDEVQLMDVGLATSAQLQAFFDEDAGRALRPRVSWWMSATLQPTWLRSVDTAARHGEWVASATQLEPAALQSGLATIAKALDSASIAADDHAGFAALIQERHQRIPDSDAHGRITLVVCNTVERATRTFEELERLDATKDLRLVHSRFRPQERAAWTSEFLGRHACRAGAERIIVATQVVEAGVDISATSLVTELAPWPCLVQRFGRCSRYGGSGSIAVVERGRDEKTSRPYGVGEMEAAIWALQALRKRGLDASIGNLEAFERQLSSAEREHLYPYRPRQLLLRRELDELFDTTPDLTGADIDVSPFIRSGDERDVSVFWTAIPPANKDRPAPAPPRDTKPSQRELCNVPFLAARDWLCGTETNERRQPRLRDKCRAWVWDWIDGEWKVAERSALVPGRVVCVAADTGGYREDGGFDPGSRASVAVVPAVPPSEQDGADDDEAGEQLSAARAYKTIATHDAEVGRLAAEIVGGLVPSRLAELIQLAGRWHDLGKAHPAFQGIIQARGPFAERADLAKAPKSAWQAPCMYRLPTGEARRGFRHELASCLALFAVLRRYAPGHAALLGPHAELLELTGDGAVPEPEADRAIATSLERQVLDCAAEEFDLLAYLVLSHHGKVRVALHAAPRDQEYLPRDDRGLPIRGVREGDQLPAISLDGVAPMPPLRLTLAPAGLGLSPQTGRSWRERTASLLRRHGPGPLAYMEALLIAADRRASKMVTADPLLGERDSDGAS